MNYYEHHLGDYAEATGHLSFVEDAAYSRCIRKYYSSEQPLPADVKQVQRIVGARTKEEKQAVDTVLREFFTLEADGWHNGRCDKEIARYQDKRSKAERSANARWKGKRSDSEGNANASDNGCERIANAVQTQCEGNALQSPVSRHQTPERERGESARASRLPPDWPLTPQRRAIAEAAGVDVAVTYANFTDHWRSAGGQNARKVDWDAAWRVWCRKDGQKQNGSRKQAKPQTAWDRVMEANRDD